MTERLTYADWAAAIRDGDLIGQTCQDCGKTQGTPKAACPACGSTALETIDLPTTGSVYAETTINVPPTGIDERGYQVAIISAGDARLMGRLDDQNVTIGDQVTLAGFDEDAEGTVTPRFEAE